MLTPVRIEIARWIIAISVMSILLVASVRDVSERRIPNWTVVTVIVLFVAWAVLEPSVSFVSSLGAGAILFAITAALFAFGLVGAGDAKLMSALALFAGLRLLLFFVLATVLFGGALAMLSLAVQPRRVLAVIQTRGKFDMGRGIPYGVAISLAGALVLLHQLSCRSGDMRVVCF
jgi:prepilin peptidase CpaA